MIHQDPNLGTSPNLPASPSQTLKGHDRFYKLLTISDVPFTSVTLPQLLVPAVLILDDVAVIIVAIPYRTIINRPLSQSFQPILPSGLADRPFCPNKPVLLPTPTSDDCHCYQRMLSVEKYCQARSNALSAQSYISTTTISDNRKNPFTEYLRISRLKAHSQLKLDELAQTPKEFRPSIRA